MHPHLSTPEAPPNEQSGSQAVIKYRELLQAVRERPAAEPSKGIVAADEQAGTYYVKVLPDGTAIYGFMPGSWVPSPLIGEWTQSSGPAPVEGTYWSNVARLSREAAGGRV